MTTFYRVLLLLYPASFRIEYAAELTRTFKESTRDRSRVGACLAAITDVIPNALAVHREILAQDLRYSARPIVRADSRLPRSS